jgi:hypothetical protein
MCALAGATRVVEVTLVTFPQPLCTQSKAQCILSESSEEDRVLDKFATRFLGVSYWVSKVIVGYKTLHAGSLLQHSKDHKVLHCDGRNF